MSRNKSFFFSLFAAFFLFSFPALSQEQGGTKPAGISVFFEKVYLHTDRDYYTSGNDIWFKAYLVNGQSNYLTNTSNNLYVELISPESELLGRHVIRMDEGTGAGDFNLGDSISSGTYKLRAYTTWMRNFGDHFIFEKELKVVSLLDLPSTDAELTEGMNKIQFFPEGGALLEGVAGKVAYKAEDQSGGGIEVEGAIFSAAGDTVGWFRSTHSGMGAVTLFPVPGERYFAKGKFNRKFPFTVALPEIMQKGFSIQVMDAGPEHLMLVVNTDPATLQEYRDKVVTIAGRHAGKICFSGDVQLKGPATPLKLAKDYFPAGIAGITLYDAEKRPQAERLVYIDRQEKEKISLNIAAAKPVYKSREEVEMKVSARDGQGNPVKTKLSLSVVDAGLVPEGISDIRSYLMLESEVKGKIENPKQYFDPENEERKEQMDLLLLSQGWRGFVWRKLQEEGISIKYLPEPGITVSGRVRKLHTDKPLEGVNISLFAEGAKGSSLYSTQTGADGRYFLDGLEFYGRQGITLTARDKKGKKEGWLWMNPVFGDTLTIKKFPLTVYRRPFTELDPLKNEENKKAQVDRQYRLSSDEFLLNEVEIAADREKERTQMIKHNAAMAVSGVGMGQQTYDFKIGEEELEYVNIGDFLEGKFPFTERQNGYVYLKLRGTPEMPKFFLDGSTVEETGNPYPDHVTSMSMGEVERIIMNGSNISIFRRENPLPPKEFSRIDKMVEGYYEAREFYTPQHTGSSEASMKPDLRTTIYWEPDISTDANGEATIKFFNSDRKGSVRAVVEGVSDKGIPLTGGTNYEVK